jgi:hypothetical protein
MVLVLTQSVTEMNTRKILQGVKRGRRVWLTTSPPSVSLLPGKCEILYISEPYRPPRLLQEEPYFTLPCRYILMLTKPQRLRYGFLWL